MGGQTMNRRHLQSKIEHQNQKQKEASHKFGDDQTEAHVSVEPDKEQKTVPAQNQVESESKEALHKFEDEEPQEIEGSDNEQATPPQQHQTPEPETKKTAAQEIWEEAIIQRAVPEQNQRPEPKPKEPSHKFGD